MKKLRLTIAMLALGAGLLCQEDARAQSNLIRNHSFEQGVQPSNQSGFRAGWVQYWVPGYTRNTPGGASGNFYGGTPDILDYTVKTCSHGYGYYRNVFYASDIGPSSRPQDGQRFVYLAGAYKASYAYNEGESILTQLPRFTCPGEYELSFWAKVPYGAWFNVCDSPGRYLVRYTIHPRNFAQVALRSTADTSRDKLIYTTPYAVTDSSWQLFTDTVTISSSDIANYNAIEFRIDSGGVEVSGQRKWMHLDNVGFRYLGSSSAVTTYTYHDTLECIETVDLDHYDTAICSGYRDTWRDNDTPVNTRVVPGKNTVYTSYCRSCDGCINYKIEVHIVVKATAPDTISKYLCYDSRTLRSNMGKCPNTNIASIEWKDPDGGITSPLTPDGSITATDTGIYEATTYYNNGCECKTAIRVTGISASYATDVVNDTLRCDTCLQLSVSSCPPGSVTGMWSHSLGTGSVVTVCPRQDESYVFTCSDIKGCTTYKAVRNVAYRKVTTVTDTTTTYIAVCGHLAAPVSVSCNGGVPYPGATYQWYDEFGYFITGTATPELPYQAPGHGKYYMHIYDAHGCLLCVQSVDIKWFNGQRGYFIDTDTMRLCPDDCVTLYFDYGNQGLFTRSGISALPFSWSLPGAPSMGIDIIDNGNGTFTFCPPLMPVTLRRYFVDPVNPACTLFYQEIHIKPDTGCVEGPMMRKNDGTNQKSLKVDLFPNPVSGECTLSVTGVMPSAVTYSVADASGRIVIRDRKMLTAQAKIDMSQAAKGTYFVKVQYNDTSVVRKLIVE